MIAPTKGDIMEGDAIAPWPDSPQEQALQSSADIVIYGGAAGGGKSYALLLAALRGYGDNAYRGAIFRRTYPQLSAPKAVIDESKGLYPSTGAEYTEGKHQWEWQSGAWLKFSHLQRESNLEDWDGAQLAFAGFDQLEQFPRRALFYMQGRCRAPDYDGKCQVFATCNPTDAQHWLFKLIRWWLMKAPDGIGFVPDPDKAGERRYLFRRGDEIIWVDKDDRDEDGEPPTSITFIPAVVEDNPAIMEKDRSYLQRLNSLGRVDRLQKKVGVWGVSPEEGMFKNHRIQVVAESALPESMPIVRYWDLADNDGRGAATASAKCGMTHEKRWCCQNDGADTGDEACLAESAEAVAECPECGGAVVETKKPVLWILHVTEWWMEGAEKEDRMALTAAGDGPSVDQAIEQEPASSGKRVAQGYALGIFADHTTHIDNPTGNKTTRAKPLVAAAERGRVKFLQGAWNSRSLEAIGDFPDAKLKDIVDAIAGAWGLLESGEVRGEQSLSIMIL